MFQTKADVDLTAIKLQRSLAQSAPGRMSNYVATVVKPAIQQRINQTFALYPGPVVRPFVFASSKSRRWYFANHPQGYTRTGELGQSWEVVVDRRANDGFLVVRNRDSSAIYVFGNRQVPGHFNTGWRSQFSQYSEEVGRLMAQLLIQGWQLVTTGRE